VCARLVRQRHRVTPELSLAPGLAVAMLRPKVVITIQLQHVLLVIYLVLSASGCWVHAEPDHPHHHEEHHDQVIIRAEDNDGHHEEHRDHDHDHHD